MKNLLSCAHVLHKTLNLVISRCCFAKDGEEMYQNLKCTCRALFCLLNPIVLWRSCLFLLGGGVCSTVLQALTLFQIKVCHENDVLFSNDTGILGKRNSEFSQQESNLRPSELLVRMLYH